METKQKTKSKKQKHLQKEKKMFCLKMDDLEELLINMNGAREELRNLTEEMWEIVDKTKREFGKITTQWLILFILTTAFFIGSLYIFNDWRNKVALILFLLPILRLLLPFKYDREKIQK